MTTAHGTFHGCDLGIEDNRLRLQDAVDALWRRGGGTLLLPPARRAMAPGRAPAAKSA